jgi:hypothetical protein
MAVITLTPAQKIKLTLLINSGYVDKDVIPTSEEIESLFLELSKDDEHGVISDFREGQCRTNIEPFFLRNYETESVAAQMFDGSWVGWTFVSGGGKHSDPESYDWITGSYELQIVSETERTIVDRVFSRT